METRETVGLKEDGIAGDGNNGLGGQEGGVSLSVSPEAASFWGFCHGKTFMQGSKSEKAMARHG